MESQEDLKNDIIRRLKYVRKLVQDGSADLDKDKMLKGDLSGIEFDNPVKMQHAYMELFQLFEKLDQIN